MTKLGRHIATLAAAILIAFSLGTVPVLGVGTDDPPPSPTDKKGAKTNTQNQQAAERRFRDNYKRAYDLVYTRADYANGIAALKALGHDEHPDVANLIGFSSRKLGRYDDARHWYEKALAADPNHVRTWSYYGMWHAEQGNRLKAQDFLEKVRAICGNADCREFIELKGAIEGAHTY